MSTLQHPLYLNMRFKSITMFCGTESFDHQYDQVVKSFSLSKFYGPGCHQRRGGGIDARSKCGMFHDIVQT